MIYQTIRPIERKIEANRQGVKRHFGVHPYFTRRPYNVVSEYVLHYSKESDVILDPFGGSGVTAIEAFLNNRTGIQNDINPLANFIAKGIADLSKGDLNELLEGLSRVISSTRPIVAKIYETNEEDLEREFSSIPLPNNIELPRTSDVRHYYDLFSRRQLIALSALKQSIDSLNHEHVRNALLLAWSASLAKLNKTFLSAEGRAESRGGSSIFSIYRYKVAKVPIELPPIEVFEERALNVISAKNEILRTIELRKRQRGWSGKFEVYSDDVEDLEERYKGKVDYIFTDPPYGGHISYLDLSTLWNAWLSKTPGVGIREKEIIVGGELKLSENHYIDRLKASISACMKMLKNDRWISVVFQHWNIRYFEAILMSARDHGGELKAAVSQVGDPIWSMHKKKNKESVLAGEMILTFYKGAGGLSRPSNKTFDLEARIDEMLEEANGSPIYGEYLFNKIILEAWRLSAIDKLDLPKSTFTGLLEQKGWHYDERNHFWTRTRETTRMLF